MTLPRHPERDDDTPLENTTSRRTRVMIVIVVALIILVLAHLTGVIKH